jgi:hypothetical protein
MLGGLPGSGLSKDKRDASQRFRAATFKCLDSWSQQYEDIRFRADDGSPCLKNPRSKALEPDCLSPQTFHYDTVSRGEDKGKGDKTQNRRSLLDSRGQF